MLQRSSELPAPATRQHGRIPQQDGEADALIDMLRTVRRNVKLIVVVGVMGTLIATAAVLSITPKYKATVTVLVDPRQTKILQDADVVGRPGTDNGAIESEVEMLKSDALMRQVVEKLKLQDDDEFNGSGGLLSMVKTVVLWPIRALLGRSSSADPLAPVVDRLDKETEAKRRGLTYVIELNAWSEDSKKAATIANTFADIYLANQLTAKSDATRRASEWLQARADEMKARVMASERALERYKAEAGLFDPGGENLSDRQISQLNDQLVDARAKTAAARAKYEELKQVTPERLRSAAASSDVLQSQVVSNLRAQYADLTKQQAEREARYGNGHPMVAAGRAQLAATEKQITAEIRRIVTSAKTEYEMASSRQESLQSSLDDLKEKAAHFNQASVKLHELDREAQANRDVFQAFLGRAKQTAELSLQIPDSRIVSAATPPAAPSYPKRTLVIALAAFGSLGLGVALALGKSAFGKGFRHSFEIESTLGLQPLASIPLVGEEFGRLPARKSLAMHGLLHPGGHAASTSQLASLAVQRPDSAFAESIRSIYLGLRRNSAGRKMGVLLVTSALPHEGKSTVAINLAQVAAYAGDTVLLIDGDLRKPSVASALHIDATHGLADVLTGPGDLNSLVRSNPATGLSTIGGSEHISGADAVNLLSSHQMAELIRHGRDRFDLVVIDSSPLLSAADARVLVEQCDAAVLVVASERTSRDAVMTVLSESPDLEDKIAGVVLNGAAEDFDRYYPSVPEAKRPVHAISARGAA
jgi:exopolysaccharide transport family protein